MSRLKTRIAALEAALRATKARNVTTPYEELDLLSQGLVDFAGELKALDDQGKAELLEELNRSGADMSADDLERMIRSITVGY